MQLGTGHLRAPQNSDILGTSSLSRSLQKQMTHRTNNQSFQKTAGITLLMTPLHFLPFHKGWSRPPAPPAAFVPLGEGQNPLIWGNVGQGSPLWVATWHTTSYKHSAKLCFIVISLSSTEADSVAPFFFSFPSFSF